MRLKVYFEIGLEGVEQLSDESFNAVNSLGRVFDHVCVDDICSQLLLILVKRLYLLFNLLEWSFFRGGNFFDLHVGVFLLDFNSREFFGLLLYNLWMLVQESLERN